MKEEKKEKKEEKKKILLPEINSEDSVFYPWEGGGIFLGIISSSSDENAALDK
ncbi:hypothetical protein KJ841_01745 [Patescibacteria group bacterium]|nr:hypothetical protein [Patescibacteria group bacterium]